jgi:hypothetical protein
MERRIIYGANGRILANNGLSLFDIMYQLNLCYYLLITRGVAKYELSEIFVVA